VYFIAKNEFFGVEQVDETHKEVLKNGPFQAYALDSSILKE
jgi:hypothetical protein